jgi:hypothetical protein
MGELVRVADDVHGLDAAFDDIDGEDLLGTTPAIWE